MKPKSIYVVEYNNPGPDKWSPDANEDGHHDYYKLRREAVWAKDNHHTGHPDDLRVRKYVREGSQD